MITIRKTTYNINVISYENLKALLAAHYKKKITDLVLHNLLVTDCEEPTFAFEYRKDSDILVEKVTEFLGYKVGKGCAFLNSRFK